MNKNGFHRNTWGSRVAGVLLAAVLVFSSFAGIFAADVNAYDLSDGRIIFKNVTGQLDFSDLMRQNFNGSVILSSQTKKYEDRTVIVSLRGGSLSDAAGSRSVSDFVTEKEGIAVAEQIRYEQDLFLQNLTDAGIPYTLEHRYAAIDNAVAVKLNTKYVKTLRSMRGVRSVVIAGGYAVPQTYAGSGAVSNVTKVYGTGVYDSADAVADGLDGSGTVVAILDTGLDYTHAAFLDMPNGTNPVSFTEEDIRRILANKDLKAEEFHATVLDVSDVYLNAKVPFAYDYADHDADVYPSYSTHGTHVAGIVAGHDASGYTDKNGNHVDEEFIGVAPEAQLVICKVFTDDLESTDLGGAETEHILAALEDCVLLGVDVINMSLGTSCGFTSTNDGDDEGEYMDRVYKSIGEQGISLVCAASNDFSSGYGSVFGTNLASNPDSGTVGSPATFGSALSVASINGKKSPYLMGNGTTPVFFEESNDKDGNPFDFIDMMLAEGQETAEFEYVVVPGVGRASDYTTAIKKLFAENPNRIALVERGDTTFKEKVEIAQSMGAKAIIVYNNVSGTIRMSLGEVKDPIPSASIDMNVGAALVYSAMNHTEQELAAGAVNRVGVLKLDRTAKAGPFMSEFSSWGCTPDLKLKPEITAHGGEITSAVPGGYDEQSGTSMASPNMAGVVALIRGYVKTANPEMTSPEVNRRVNQLLMSTATTVYDRDGLPYSPRKQGAGLGSLDNARSTAAFLWTDNAANDYRPKVELGDDVAKKGEYTVPFCLTNFGDKTLTFSTQSVFMTETLAIDGLSVAEQAYLLTDLPAAWTVDGKTLADGDRFAVPAGKTVSVSLTVKLSDAEKKYIDDSFANGMFVEGFAKLLAADDGQCDLELPFMGFYGDWTKAPMLDYDAYELVGFQQDSSILEDEKPQACVWGTQPYTVYSNGEYVLPMGGYVYLLDENDDPMYLSMEHNAISCFNEYFGEYDENNYLTAYKLKGLYAGLLRNARSVDYQLINADTGEVLESETVYRIGKAYADGGTARPAFVDIPLDPVEYELVSNGHYTMTFAFWLDYGDGSCSENTFSYDFTVDYEAPLLQDARIRYYDYKDGNKTKQRIYLDLDVYDNHYAQSAMLCYLDGNELVLATDYVTPIRNANCNGTTTVSIEITGIYDTYKDCLYVQLDDYALNHSVYWLNLSAVNPTTAPEKFELAEGEGTLELSAYETHTVALEGIGESSLSNFRWTSSNRSVADVRNGEIVGISEGKARITVSNSVGESRSISVTVKPGGSRPETPSISFGPIKDGDGVLTKAQGQVKVYPGMSFKLNILTDPWYYPLGELSLAWESTDAGVAQVDDTGAVTTLAEGTAVVKATILDDGRPTAYTASVTLDVKDPFVVENNSLIRYKGPGGVVEIPTDKNIMQIGEGAFRDNDRITEVVIPKSVTAIGKNAFENCTSLQAVYFDKKAEQPIADADISVIYARAFAGCTALEVLDLSNVKVVTLGRECFYGCTSLREIRKMYKIGTATDYAFAGCTSLTEIDLTGLRVSGTGTFAGCSSLTGMQSSWFTSIGKEMFVGCSALRVIDLTAQTVGERAFFGCTSLREVNILLPDGETEFTHFIGAGAFAGCTALQSFHLEKGCTLSSVGDYAFGSTALTSFTIPATVTVLGKDILSGSRVGEILLGSGFSFDGLRLNGAPFGDIPVRVESGADCVLSDGVLYSADRKTLLLVLPGVTQVTVPAGVTAIGDYAFAGSAVTSLTVPSSVTSIGVGAFAGSALLSVDLSASAITALPARVFAETKLTSVTVPASVTLIGEEAFAKTPLESVRFAGNGVKCMEDRVFADCKRLTAITLPDGITEMGSGSFSGCAALETAVLPSVHSLGSMTFRGCDSLRSVSFGAGATTLGELTFYRNTALTEVNFGDGVQTVGNNVFYGCTSLQSIDLHKVTAVEESAFAECTSLSDVSGMDRLTAIGKMAFYNCSALTELDLRSAVTVGAGAFAIENGEKAYTSLSLPNVREIGVMAFMGGGETAVTLPATLETLGYGAFSGSASLNEFRVEDSKHFFTKDGVLYRHLPNGTYELSAYPGAYAGENGVYTVIDGTSVVASYTFNRIQAGVLNEVILPYSLTGIGVSAFFESGIETYTFRCIHAPTLQTVYREDAVELLQQNATGNEIAINGLYYSNFDSLFAKHTEIVGEKSTLRKRVPANGIGYDNYIYSLYFGKTASLGVLMDDITRAAISALQALEEVETVRGWTSLGVDETNRAFLIAFAEQVKEAHRLYNNILSNEQRAFVPEELVQKLTEIETLMRALKEKFGIPLVVSDLRPNDGYRKEYTAGESFSMDGLVLTVVYDDYSTENADPAKLVLITPADGVLTEYDNFVVFEYRYAEGLESYPVVNIPVTVRPADGGAGKSGMPTWAILLLIGGGVAGAGVAGSALRKHVKAKANAKPISRKPLKIKKHHSPLVGRVIRLTCAGIAGVGVIALIVFAAVSSDTGRSEQVIDIKAQIVYKANGGLFENNMDEKTVGYGEGTCPMEIGKVMITNGSVGISRQSHLFLGWFYPVLDASGAPVMEDGVVKTGDPYDFTRPMQAGEDITLYAGWVKEKTLPVLLAGDALTDKNGNVYQVGDVLRELTANVQGEFVKFTGSNLLSLPSGQYTFVQYYTDAECTDPVSWPITVQADEEQAQPIYAKFIAGDWKIVSDTESAKRMLSSLISGRYYVIADIDMDGATVSISNNPTFGAVVEGNGHTVSNFKVVKRGVESQGTSLLGTFKDGAALHGLTLADFRFDILLKGDATQMFFLFGSMPTNADISDCTVRGSMKISCPEGSVIGNIQPSDHSHWILPIGTSDADALADGRITVEATCELDGETYTYPEA